jgi:HEAT repeat protein
MTDRNSVREDHPLTRAIAGLVIVIVLSRVGGCGSGDPRALDRASVAPSPIHLPAAAEQLSEVSLTVDDVAARFQAVDAVGDIGGEEAISVLQQALLDPELEIREAAVHALTDIGSDESVAALAYALDDDDARLREATVYGLGRIGGPAATGLLQCALMDSDDRVRNAAAETLAELTTDGFDDAEAPE